MSTEQEDFEDADGLRPSRTQGVAGGQRPTMEDDDADGLRPSRTQGVAGGHRPTMEDDDDGYDYLVEAAYEALVESGFTDVRVSGYEDLPEPAPLEEGGIVPDLTAMNNKGMLFLFEICPKEAFALAELAERLLALAAHAEAKQAQIVLIVPEGEADLAGAFLEEYAIPEDRLTVWEA